MLCPFVFVAVAFAAWRSGRSFFARLPLSVLLRRLAWPRCRSALLSLARPRCSASLLLCCLCLLLLASLSCCFRVLVWPPFSSPFLPPLPLPLVAVVSLLIWSVLFPSASPFTFQSAAFP